MSLKRHPSRNRTRKNARKATAEELGPFQTLLFFIHLDRQKGGVRPSHPSMQTDSCSRTSQRACDISSPSPPYSASDRPASFPPCCITTPTNYMNKGLLFSTFRWVKARHLKRALATQPRHRECLSETRQNPCGSTCSSYMSRRTRLTAGQPSTPHGITLEESEDNFSRRQGHYVPWL